MTWLAGQTRGLDMHIKEATKGRRGAGHRVKGPNGVTGVPLCSRTSHRVKRRTCVIGPHACQEIGRELPDRYVALGRHGT